MLGKRGGEEDEEEEEEEEKSLNDNEIEIVASENIDYLKGIIFQLYFFSE